MDAIPGLSAWRDMLLQIATEFSTRLAAFVPSLLGALALLLLGWLLSRLVEVVAARMLRSLGLDRVSTRIEMDGVLGRAGMRSPPSQLVARLVFWLMMLTFLLSSAEILGLDAVTATIDRVIGFVPSLASAALTLIAGFLFARFVGGLVTSSSPSGIPGVQRLGFLVTLVIGSLTLVIAVELLGIETNVLVVPLTAVLLAASLSVGLTFALGAYPIVTHILAGHFLKDSLPRDVYVEVDGGRGIVERVGATETVLRDGEASFSVPNAKLLELVVKR